MNGDLTGDFKVTLEASGSGEKPLLTYLCIGTMYTLFLVAYEVGMVPRQHRVISDGAFLRSIISLFEANFIAGGGFAWGHHAFRT